MTPEQLKKSIFFFAMQGKLVEQKDEEGTGEDLYIKIIEKAKVNKNVIPIDVAELPFEIPMSWKWCKFGEIVDYSMGKTPPRAEAVWWGADIPWVSISDMTDYGYVTETKERVSNLASEKLFGNISKAGTLLMSFKLTVGRTSILDIDALHNEAIISIYPYLDESNILRDYLFYILPIVTRWGDSKNAIKGKTLNSKSIANLMIPLPPLEEQNRIIEKIKELLPYVEKYAIPFKRLEAINREFPKEMEKSILQYAIQGKLVEQKVSEGTGESLYKETVEKKAQMLKNKEITRTVILPDIQEDEEKPFDIPDNWKWVRLENLCTKITSGSTPSGGKNSNVYKPSGIPLFREQNVYNDGIREEGLVYISEELSDSRTNSKVYGKDILLNITGGSIGRCALVPETFEVGDINQHILIIRLLEPSVRFYIHYCMCSPYIQNIINEKAVGAKAGFSGEKCKNLLIPLPPLEEQQRIVKKIEELLPYCERLRK